MFLGHLTAGVTGKRVAPAVSHSLLAGLAWSIAGAVVYRLAKKSWRGGAVAGAVVLSQWVLEFLTHCPDLPLWPNGPLVGLGRP